jgi:dihydropteroate synthase
MFPLTLGKRTLTWGTRTYMMGILNITPDSFSGDGLLAQPAQEAASARIDRFVSSGVDILDVGGESTRPGAEPVTVQEELRRVLPVIEHIAANYPQVLISIDTYKAPVAKAALQSGAHMINDVWGLRVDPAMPALAAREQAAIVLMHNRSKPGSLEVRTRLGNAYLGAEYTDLLADVRRELMESVGLARAAGIPEDHILLDPGIGFGKTVQQNLELIDRLGEIRELGYPVLLGPSRKSFIGYTLDLPPDQRLEGTAAAIAVGIARGADIVRVHDVEVMARVMRMTDAIVRRPGARP